MSSREQAWARIGLLGEPTRRRVYRAVRAAGGALTRDDVAQLCGIDRKLAAFHLDRLAKAGLVAVDYARPPGRAGPGAGRPAKRYTAAGIDVAVGVPQRSYRVVAAILAAAIAEAPEGADEHALVVAAQEGRRLGGQGRTAPRRSAHGALAAARSALDEIGYEPEQDGRDGLVLRNCPFHDVVPVARHLVCGVNRELVGGVLAGLEVEHQLSARLDPQPGRCCVIVEPAHARAEPMG